MTPAQDSLDSERPADRTPAAIGRRAHVQKLLQQSAAIALARWLQSLGADVAPFSWSYER